MKSTGSVLGPVSAYGSQSHSKKANALLTVDRIIGVWQEHRRGPQEDSPVLRSGRTSANPLLCSALHREVFPRAKTLLYSRKGCCDCPKGQVQGWLCSAVSCSLGFSSKCFSPQPPLFQKSMHEHYTPSRPAPHSTLN